jgi:hypothetical protein
MNFQYWSIGDYRANMHIFNIEKEYKLEMDSVYTANRVTIRNDGTNKYPLYDKEMIKNGIRNVYFG